MRDIDMSMDMGVVEEIDRRLDGVEVQHGVKVAWAIESGSRAWGFPSPDSDYDARFIYVRSADAHVSPWNRRDVIETPLDEVFDVNGWDAAKAVGLMVKGNATVNEWLRSPIVYRGDLAFVTRMRELQDELFEPELTKNHYVSVGRDQYKLFGSSAKVKKFLYSLRPALVLSWMEAQGDQAVPMDVDTLLAGADVGAHVEEMARELIEKKRSAPETGMDSVPKELEAFVLEKLERPRVSTRRVELETARMIAHAGYRDLVRIGEGL
jgi:predicted nucleotidyltransferase